MALVISADSLTGRRHTPPSGDYAYEKWHRRHYVEDDKGGDTDDGPEEHSEGASQSDLSLDAD